jgi:tetratricopeptide (TPR) repeat protein
VAVLHPTFKAPAMNKFYLLTLFCSLYFFSCKTANRAYEKGDYTDAIDLSIKKLQKNPSDGGTKAMLQNAYHFAVNEHEDQIRILSASSRDERFEQMYKEYAALQKLYETINQYPSAAGVVKPTDYSGYIQTYRDKAAGVHYEKGIEWMKGEDKSDYREAYAEFGKALQYKPADIDIKRKREEAYNAAIVKVVVSPIGTSGNYYFSSNSYSIRRFQDEVIRNLNFHSGNTFVKYFTEWDARSNNMQPDEILEMQLGSMRIGQPYDEYSTREVSKEVVIKEIVHKKDSVVKEYGRVTARITTTRRTLVSDAELFVTARNTRGRILWSDNFRGEHRWQTELTTYQGDERALSESDKAAMNRRDRNAPRQDEITDELLKQLQNDLQYRLRNYYQRYN